MTLAVYRECRPAFFLENAMGKQFGMDWMELNTELLLPCCSSKENGGAAFTLNVEGQMEIRHPEKEQVGGRNKRKDNWVFLFLFQIQNNPSLLNIVLFKKLDRGALAEGLF